MTEAIVRLVSASFLARRRRSRRRSWSFGFVFFAALGLLQRLMPQVQIFFVAMPLQMVIGFSCLLPRSPREW